MKHNSSPKPLRRLRHALWALSAAGQKEIESNMQFSKLANKVTVRQPNYFKISPA